MRYLIFILLFSFSAHANWVKESALKSPSTIWMGQERCESVEGEKCFNITNKDLRRWKKGLVDNLDLQKYSKEDFSVCSGRENCEINMAGKDCSTHGEGAYGVINIDYTEAYCAKPNGFFQKDGLVADADGIEAADQEDQDKADEMSGRSTKKGNRFAALKTCAVNADSLTNLQLKTCLKRLIREVLASRLLLSEL